MDQEIVGIIAIVTLISPFIFPFLFPKKEMKEVRVGDEVDWFIEQIDHSRKEILIVAGELHENIYDNSALLQALENAHKRGVSVKIIAGPAVVIPDNTEKDGDRQKVEKSKPFLKLAAEKTIEFYVTGVRKPSHFTIFDGKTVYKEERHTPYQDVRQRTRIINSFFEARRLQNLFNEYKKETIPYPEAYDKRILKLEYGKEIVQNWLETEEKYRVFSELFPRIQFNN
jgi:hypothetical protein